MGEHLDRARDEAGRHHVPGGCSTADSPDERTVPSILVGILDALIAIAERLPVESAGICADRPEPLVMAGGRVDRPWCELRAGHAGAHGSGDGRHWSKATTTHPTASAGLAENEGESDG